MTNYVHQGDLPEGLSLGNVVAIDSETMGLNYWRDSLCVVQCSAGDGDAHLVQLDRQQYDAPRLKAMLADKNVTKLFHFARFDVAMFKYYLDVDVASVYCTKIVSKLVRTYSDHHGLKDLCQELLGMKISKQQQSSDWGRTTLSQAQIDYAAADVLYLHEIKQRLDEMLQREGRVALAQDCCDFLPTRVALDLAGWGEHDIFSHSSK